MLKTSKIMLSALLSLTLLSGIAVFAADSQESTISVDNTINSEVAPDTATIRFYIENSGTNLADIKEKNDKIANDAINAVKKKLNKDESIKTIAFRVNNVYSYKDKVRIFSKYEVTNGFEVKLKDLNKVSDVIKTAMAAGVKKVDSLNFSVENGNSVCNDLMAKSITMAKTRAQILAQAAGSDIARIKNINPYCSLNSSYIQPRLYANSSMKMTDGAAGMAEDAAYDTIEAGQINVRAGVNMTYYLK